MFARSFLLSVLYVKASATRAHMPLGDRDVGSKAFLT